MMNVRIIGAALAVMIAGIGPGCETTGRGHQAGTVSEVSYGEVQEVREVTLEGTSGTLGAVGGAVLGGAVGSAVGGGSGQRIGTAAGGVGGAVAGGAAEQRLTRRPGLEIIVDLEDGRTLGVLQEADEEFFPGERVQVLRYGDGSMRVRKTQLGRVTPDY